MLLVSCPLRSGLISASLLAASFNAMSASSFPSGEVDACLQAAAIKHGIAYPLLRAIAEQESSFNPRAVRRPLAAGNSDGSTDYGLMQINSGWLSTVARYGISRDDLYKPCINADVGAWILASNFKRLGVTWNAVGAYNAQTSWKRVRYATGVHHKLQRYLASAKGVLPSNGVSYANSASESVVVHPVALGVWEASGAQ